MSRNNADALAVLHQLSSDPHMLGQIQNLMSLLSNNSNSVDEEDEEELSYASRTSQNPSSSSLSSPAVTLGQQQPQQQQQPRGSQHNGTRTTRTAPHGSSAKAAEPNSVPVARYAALLQRCTTAEETADAWARRFRTSEADVEQLTRDLRLLEEKLEEQRRLHAQLESKRETDLVNAERIYAAALRRQDEAHEQAVRQLIKSHQLQQTAMRYEEAVRHKSRTTGLMSGTTPVNVRQTYKNSSGSHVKRERSDVDDVLADRDALKATTDASQSKYARSERLTGRTRVSDSSSWKETSELITLKDDEAVADSGTRVKATAGKSRSDLGHTPSTTTRSRYHSDDATAGTSEAFRSTRRTAAKRRTPRTPSMTHADRVASQSGTARSPIPADRTQGTTKVLPTGSWKLDSPVPAHAEATRVSPRPVTTASAMSRYQAQHQTSEPARQPPTTKAGNATEEMFVSQYATTTTGAPRPIQAKPGVAPVSQKMATARLPGPTVADATGPVSPRPASPSALNISTGAVSGTSSAVAGGPTRSPSPLNPKRGAVMVRRFIFTGLKEEEIVRLQKAIDTLGDDAKVLDADQDAPPPFETTHIVLNGTPRSVKAMCGVVSSRWLVSPEYVYNSLKAGFWLDEFEEGGLRFFPSPLKCQRFLLTMEHDDIRRKLEQVIEYGGGEVVKSTTSSASGRGGGATGVAQDVVVVSCGDDLLQFATHIQS